MHALFQKQAKSTHFCFISFHYVVRRLQELGRATRTYSEKILSKACSSSTSGKHIYNSVDRELLRVVHGSANQRKCYPLSASSAEACELTCVRMAMSIRENGLMRPRGCCMDMCCHHLFSVSFFRGCDTRSAGMARFSEDPSH